MADAWELTRTASDGRASSSATIAVISLVMLAIASERPDLLLREDGAVLADEVPRRTRGALAGSLRSVRGLNRRRQDGKGDDPEQDAAHHRVGTVVEGP